MKKLFLLTLLCVLGFAQSLKIASLNVENLFDDVYDGSEYADFSPPKCAKFLAKKECDTKRIAFKLKEKQRYEAKLQAVSAFLAKLDADVVALQEVENERVLSSVARLSGFKHFAFATTKNAPVGLGFISKFPLTNQQKFIVKNVKTRPVFAAQVAGVTLLNVHFPAYSNGRKKQNKAAFTAASAAKNFKNAVILGDFNSRYTLQKFSGKRDDFLLLNEVRSGEFVSLWEDAKKPFQTRKKGSHKNGKIDNILLKKSLFGRYEKGSFEVIDTGGFSDHKALVFRLKGV